MNTADWEALLDPPPRLFPLVSTPGWQDFVKRNRRREEPPAKEHIIYGPVADNQVENALQKDWQPTVLFIGDRPMDQLTFHSDEAAAVLNSVITEGRCKVWIGILSQPAPGQRPQITSWKYTSAGHFLLDQQGQEPLLGD